MTKRGKLIGPFTAVQLGLSENHIFVDTNVLVGGYSGKSSFQKDADCLHYLFSLKGKKLYISTLSVAQLISMFQKKHTNEEIVGIVRELQHRFTVIDFTNRDIDAALVETGADIEDNVQYVLAKKQKCRIVITNNYKDYRALQGIQVFRPTEVRRLPR
ncbi:MAG: type II toxin-antitoxin system VapC family toxin [Bacteroidaceae bacterium]|nr:type II toxin-antitoxin system VapC family toxin [Bacteroidaceae bacterium]